jgi:hypothetical protein
MGGEGTVIADYGTEVELTNANPIGSGFVPGVTGPSVNELIGGAGNIVTFGLESPPRDMTLADLAGGEVTVRIEFIDASAVSAAIDITDLTADINDITSLFTPAWSAQTGKQIVSVQTHVGTPFTAVSGETITSFFFNLSVSVGGDFAAIDCVPGIDSTIPIGGTLIPDYTQPILAVVPPELGLIGTVVQTATVYIPIDATSILTNPLVTRTVLDPYGQDVFADWTHVYFASFEGWTIVSEAITATANYGVSAHGPLAATSIINTLIVSIGGGSEWGHIQPLVTPVATPPASIPYVVDSETHFRIFIRTDPATTAAVDPPILVTEPYEIRQRNLPAFKFSFSGAGDTPPTIGIKLMVSQGDPTGNPDNTHREWTQITVDSVVSGTVYKEILAPGLSTSQQYTNLPDNYSGAVLTISKEFAGPWNYARFIIDSSPLAPDYSGIFLQIIANAREL